MDAESLMVGADTDSTPPADNLLEHATLPEHWLGLGNCAAGEGCPFCTSQAVLVREGPRASLLQMLRWYELGSGKRWSFRDLFSLISYLLAGHHPAGAEQQADPCGWAARMLVLDKSVTEATKPRKQALAAIFHLATSTYQHALFHKWDADASTALRKDIRELGLDENHVLMGLYHFLQDRKAPYLPATIAASLSGMSDLLDPALANSDCEVAVSSRNSILLRELDVRFSRSVGEGLEHIKKYKSLWFVELDLLKRLADADSLLSSSAIRRKRPAAATRIQRTIRDFACRLVRRSICAKSAVVADAEILTAFQKVVEDEGGGPRLYEIADQVEKLLNNGQDFDVSLTTTFGQPLPPPQRQATLVVPSRQVGMRAPNTLGRPRSPICFLEVGSGQSAQPIALTYDLFKAVKELERGLSQASLPLNVLALLDTTRARLSGPIVRDAEILKRAKIRIGTDGAVVTRSWNGFVSRTEGTAP